MLNSKNGQIGDTLTWFIATIIIIVILFLAILTSSLFGKSEERKVINPSAQDLLKSKEVMSYLVTPLSSSNFVFSQIVNSGNLDQVTGPLAVEIFKTNLESFYKQSSIIISYRENDKIEQLENPYFDSTIKITCNSGILEYTKYCDTLKLNSERGVDFSFSK